MYDEVLSDKYNADTKGMVHR